MELRNTTLDDLASTIGFSATARLAAWYGDAGNLYVPATAEPNNVLSRLIGIAAARKLSEAWGGEFLAIPRLRDHEDDVRKNRIGRMLEKGFNTREIARLERISERRVQQICRELEQAGLIKVVGPAKRGRPPGPVKAVRKVTETTT